MSRGVEGRAVAWQVWRAMHAAATLPIAYEHQCGSLGKLPDNPADYHEIMCPGCRFELARPEQECTPLYGPQGPSVQVAGEVQRALAADPNRRAVDLREGVDQALRLSLEMFSYWADANNPTLTGPITQRLTPIIETLRGTAERDDRVPR